MADTAQLIQYLRAANLNAEIMRGMVVGRIEPTITKIINRIEALGDDTPQAVIDLGDDIAAKAQEVSPLLHDLVALLETVEDVLGE